MRMTDGGSFLYLLGPRSFDQLWVDNFRPAVLALDVRAVLEEGGHRLPYFSSALHNPFQFLVLERKEKTRKKNMALNK